MTERLDKLISDSGLYSRSEARTLVRAGRVSVDGETVTAPERKFPREAAVRVDGAAVNCSRYRYFMLDKPAEYRGLGLFPVGRLDRDTTGLLLLTNDGDYAHRVISPKSKVEKCYLASTEGQVTAEDVSAFAEGLTLADGTQCLPAKLEPLEAGRCLVRVMEGKYHQVKRMLASRGKPVTALRRLSIGALSLPEASEPGELRELDEKSKNLALTQY